MNYTTLVSTDILEKHLHDPDWIIIDCRFSLTDPTLGAKNYRLGHIENARYAHLDKDLSSAVTANTGRHPLPNIPTLVKTLGCWGITDNTQVIVYDDACGAFAGRLWWLLRYLGHHTVAVLDGGINYWKKQGLVLTTTLPKVKEKPFNANINHSYAVNTNEIINGLATRDITLIDARTSDRFAGKNEPIDPVAGHIPGAINRAFQNNFDTDGLFLSRAELAQQFAQLTGATDSERIVHMCGSGVTACHNLLAMEHAGLSGSKLYPGSWSEWITNRNRSVVTTERL